MVIKRDTAHEVAKNKSMESNSELVPERKGASIVGGWDITQSFLLLWVKEQPEAFCISWRQVEAKVTQHRRSDDSTVPGWGCQGRWEPCSKAQTQCYSATGRGDAMYDVSW